MRLSAWSLSRLGWLERPLHRRMLLVAALLLVSPTLFSGFAFDDYLFIYQIERPAHDEWAGTAPFDLFRWVDAAHEPHLLDGQGLPWWSFDGTSVAFMRPVSSLTHALDHWLWPRNAFAMHLHSLFWFVALLLVAVRTYAELNESRFVAAVASAMFLVDSAHGATVGWISNRNALIGGVFAIAALLFHHRHRSGQRRFYALLAALCFALGMLSTEAAIGCTGYLLAYALCVERTTLRARCASLLPYAAIAAGWAALRHYAHYGVIGLGGYLDPIKEPLAFIRMLPQRAFVLLAGQIGRLCADLFDWVPIALQPLILVAAVVCCGLVLAVAWPALRANRRARFWACGALLSTLPLTAAVPSDRLLTLVGLGVMPTLACVIHDALSPAATPARAWAAWFALLRRDVAIGLVFIHLVLDPLLLPLLALLPSMIAKATHELDASLSSSPALTGQTVIVAAIPDSWMLSYLPVMRSINGQPRPDKLHWLLATQGAARFERRGSNALRVTADHGFFDRRWFERNWLHPLHRGDHVKLSEMSVTVLEVTPDGRPATCDFVFSQPLESSKYVWLTWREGRLEPFSLPSEGQHASLAASRF